MERSLIDIINQRRRQIIVHSVLYYRMNESCIQDAIFDRWSKELVELQKQYPQEAKQAPFAREFESFDGSTGFQFADNSWGIGKANQLLSYKKKLDQMEEAKKPQKQKRLF